VASELRRPIDTGADEERILRVWTPIILRTILVAAIVVLVGGLFSMAWQSPGYYVAHFRRLQNGGPYEQREAWSDLAISAFHGNPHGIMTIGLMVLTLVPLARVGFCFLLFLKERDYTYVLLTAYVLAGLIFGVVLGRVG
jgi:uncharacterized membrane protein